MMIRVRLFAFSTIVVFALGLSAQNAATQNGGQAQSGSHVHKMPSAEDHLKALSEKLHLSDDQQSKARPIIEEMHEATQKILQDESLTREQRHEKMMAERQKADKNIREFLTDEQKKKLDQLEQQPHPELHGKSSQ